MRGALCYRGGVNRVPGCFVARYETRAFLQAGETRLIRDPRAFVEQESEMKNVGRRGETDIRTGVKLLPDRISLRMALHFQAVR